ncbi:monofunctional biosynthetic peptidoglycan transglycosylase [Candidatus Thiodictyon syntrophicum]|uniref:Biosynthetic peptidoglycan transglycosylase n=1 Tax=Candidatus Thiodictyon syntrophicum TaxID=1166950 RepID=A0A2K8U4B1_9GAMM|nr:monofunctional biosynthetic peptidoglycan transglycosylase [Candidatus Thiodictyon syntrophicum]AUB79881.1 monofunctional biosynthetic peptidoglycan transglycosylase [Candidatus Thiodictyon syntrophicum]
MNPALSEPEVPQPAAPSTAAPPVAALGGPRWSPRGVLRVLWYLLSRGLAALALGSALLVGALRWIDPPVSSFMVRQALVAWRIHRAPPYFYHAWVPWGRIPPVLPLAVIAGEDQRFAYHHGFDPVELRQALAAWRRGGTLRGASTITQQTAKNLFLWSGRSWVRKGLEAWFAALMEVLWSKQRILEVYLNIVQFSPSTYGVGAASERYFHRAVDDITLREAALLAAVLPAPGAYRLDRPSARLQRRADWIADQTQRIGGRRYLERL